jgi:capsular polysaccharide export protein
MIWKVWTHLAWHIQTLLKSHRLAFKLDIPYVQTLLEIGHFEDALDVIHAVASVSQSYQSAVATSRCLTYLDRYAEAESLIDRTLATHKNKLVYDEALKICLYTGNYSKADRLLSEAFDNKIDLGQTLPCKIALGTHRYADGFKTYREVGVSIDLARAFPLKHISNESYNYSGKSITLLPIYGPGDEIRFASIYNSINKILDFEEISIGVEPRLFKLFERSFSESNIKFFSTQRVLRNERISLDSYDKLPFANLMAAMDNHAADYCEKSSSVGLVTDLLADLLKDSSDFSGSAYLKADPSQVQHFRSQLPSSGPLIGLNWRSSVTLQSRQEHYLSVDDLIPLFESTHAQFVNLQYDDCTEELAFIEKKFPGRLVNLTSLDQYNDLDGVASLISCLDLVIAPCTTVAELSGALGQETLLLANSSEIEWRVRKSDSKDIWHNSIEHVFGNRYRDKSSLVLALIERLNSWLSRI